MTRTPLILAAIAAAGCHSPPRELVVELGIEDRAELEIEVDGARELVIDAGDDVIVELAVDAGAGMTARWDGDSRQAPAWFRPRPRSGPMVLELDGAGTAQVSVWTRGRALAPVDPERAVVWHAAAPLDHPEVVSFARLMAAASSDGHGGGLLEAWFERFSTTPASSRSAPAALLEPLRARDGDDPSAWDLDALPFAISAVHNRIDLWPTEGGCGQLRVTATATPSEGEILHLIFLFRQPAAADDIAPDGTVHCLGTARRWSRLSPLTDDELTAAAAPWLAAALVPDRFALAESLELSGGVWEWRQWLPTANPDPALPFRFENPPLFQSVDIDSLNLAGPLRDDFLAFVAENADAIAARTAVIPERFRAPIAQMSDDDTVPPHLDLTGLDPIVAADHPNLATELELMGCIGCHTTPATEFNQTYPGRFFSDFQFHEVEARAVLLDAMNAGIEVDPPGFGPLQDH